MTFEEAVETQFVVPLLALLDTFSAEHADEEYAFFAGVLAMVEDKSSEVEMLGAIFELSRCAFLGFAYSPVAQSQINSLLDYWIEAAHTMSAEPTAH